MVIDVVGGSFPLDARLLLPLANWLAGTSIRRSSKESEDE